MMFLGFVFVALAGAAAIAIIADSANNATDVTLSTLFTSFHGMSVTAAFLLGAVVAGVFLLGCTLVLSGARRSARVRRQLRDLREQQDESLQVLLAEKAQLERELARERHRAQAMTSHSAVPITAARGDLNAG